MKPCTECRHEKPARDFYKSKTHRGGRQPICIECSKVRARLTNQALAVLRERHREEYLEIRRDLMEAG